MLVEYNFMFFPAYCMSSVDVLYTDSMLNIKCLNFVVL